LLTRSASKPSSFSNVETCRDDVAIIAFTSGSTGEAKGCVHFHRDVLLICDGYAKHLLNPSPDDVFSGTPPFAFTFGLGGMMLFPMRFGASAVLFERPSPADLLQAIQERRITCLFTAPTMYRELLGLLDGYDVSSLRNCVSAGEHLPPSTFEAWREATGLELLDGIGATEMLHIFISAGGGEPIRAGSTGKPVPGYEARVVDDEGNELPRGQVGRLAVRGLTGCRYLDDTERQRDYVQNGWNLTGDTYLQDDDGYFWYQARSDDMIISSGYNIAGPEVEDALLEHAAVHECAVVGLPDERRGNVVSAFIVLREPERANDELIQELQEHVKAVIAPYKYPRRIEFLATLPRTETGKLQRFRLREIYGGE
jgi:2-aminobenzoate-CoA ligase